MLALSRLMQQELPLQKADNPDDPFDETDSGDTVRCDRSKDPFCDVDDDDDGVIDDVPEVTWKTPDCKVVPNKDRDPNKCYK